MGIVIPPAKKDFPLHPEGGPFAAVLSEIRSHEGVETAFGVKDRLQLIFQTGELQRDHVEGVDDDSPMTVSEFLNATLAEKGKLMGFLSQVSGVALKPLTVSGATFEELEALLLGSQWMLSIVHNESNGRTYANIANAMRAPDSQNISIWGEDGL
jgi:hypothetical protein